MRTDRKLSSLILLNLLTFGIYGLWYWNRFARDMNTCCREDGEHTAGVLRRLVLGVLTLGIYELVWLGKTGDRIARNCQAQGIPCPCTGASLLLWQMVGSLILIGPLVAAHQLLRGMNCLAAHYTACQKYRWQDDGPTAPWVCPQQEQRPYAPPYAYTQPAIAWKC